MQFILKHKALIIKIISIIQIIGGVTGLMLMAYLLMHMGTVTGPNLLIVFIGLGLFIFSIYCGKLLLKEKERKTGIILSIVNQATQILQFSMLDYSFNYNSGVSLTIGIEESSLTFKINAILSSFTMAIHSHYPFSLKVNIAALAIMCMLIEVYNKSKKDKEAEIIN